MAETQQAAALLVVGEDGSVNGTNGDNIAAALQSSEEVYDKNDNCAHENGQDEGPTVDIIINNVVASYTTRCHLDLRKIAMDGKHVEYKRENGMCNMKIRRPYTTATIWSSGKITCTGATSEEASKIASRKFARQLQRMGFKVKFANFRIVNVLGTCILPFRIKITNFSRKYREHASYEPELHPGVTYKIKSPKATLKIFSTGSITVTAPCVANVQSAIEHIFPLVMEFRADDEEVDKNLLENETRFIRKQRGVVKPKRPVMKFEDYDNEVDSDELDSDESFDSDESQD